MNKKQRIVIDASESPEKRKLVEAIEKFHNKAKGSKFIKPSFSVMGYSYNASRK